MKFLEFTYTKSNGDVSERAVVVTQEPTKLLSGIDVSELPELEFATFIQDMRELKNRQHQEIMDLMAKHDLKHNYRQFSSEKMTNVQSEWV